MSLTRTGSGIILHSIALVRDATNEHYTPGGRGDDETKACDAPKRSAPRGEDDTSPPKPPAKRVDGSDSESEY